MTRDDPVLGPLEHAVGVARRRRCLRLALAVAGAVLVAAAVLAALLAAG
jgi:hypothetical protein